MNLKTQIKDELWLTISNSYEAENYRNAILDAMQYLSDLLREKSGSDNDGAKLVADATGGNNPKVKINKYQTQSEQDEHSGLHQILLGMYRGIRNPRSHEQITDNKNDTDRIIYFIDYLISILDEAKSPFNLEDFIEQRVFDENFVQSEQYADLIINEIPIKKRLDVLIEIFRKKTEGDGNKLQIISFQLFDIISDDDKQVMLKIISDSLKTVNSEDEIRRTLQLLPTDLWLELEEVSKMRIENILIESISQGYISNENLTGGALGTWARRFLKHFTLQDEVSDTIIAKLSDKNELEYVLEYFFAEIPEFMDDESYRRYSFIHSISHVISNGDTSQNLRGRIRSKLMDFPDDWKEKFTERLKNAKNEDGTPFTLEMTVDDIPF